MANTSDPFLENLVQQVSKFEDRAHARFGRLDDDRLAWQPGERQWCIGQCLEHLIDLNELYFPVFTNIANGRKRSSVIERLPVLPRIWGKFLLNSVDPDSQRKIRAPRKYDPHVAAISPDIVEKFCAHQQALAASMTTLNGIDLDARIITSPVLGFVTYSLRDALAIIVAHEERHLNQADRVLEAFEAHHNATA